MKRKMTGAAGLVGAFVAGMVVATALGGGMAGTRAAAQGQQVTVQRVISPTMTDEDIALLRRDLRAMKNAGDWAEHVAVGGGGAEVLTDLQPLCEGLATSER